MPELAASPQVNSQPNLEPVPASGPAKGSRSYISIVVGVLAVLVAALAIWIGVKALNNTGSSSVTNPTTVINQPQTPPEIKSDADFQKLEEDLNNTDVDGLAKDLDQNDTDAAGF